MKKLLLRKDIPKLGHVGDVVEVSDGYARNYLVPHHLAVEPTSANLKAIEDEKKAAAAKRLEVRKQLEARGEALTGVEVTIAAAANEEGHLYGSVGPREIAAALRDEGHAIESAQVSMHDPIRQLDSVMVPVVLAEDLKVEVKVWVVRERASEQLDEEEGDASGKRQSDDDMDEGVGHGGTEPTDEYES
ncbi:MAG: 50S ribosomal protein L9 [Phycisphaerae bacterium]|nr:50S ribosomal protein L9 [Phycisphaerae bacterium]